MMRNHLFAGLIIFIFMFSLFLGDLVGRFEDGGFERTVFSKETTTRKLLGDGDDGGMNRIGAECWKNDIVITQGQTTPLPNGIPTYTVEILNMDVSGCAISNIHVTCGWFSSARMVNPRLFRRLYYNDCLVNNGDPLAPRQTIAFVYANTYPYKLSVSSASCCSS